MLLTSSVALVQILACASALVNAEPTYGLKMGASWTYIIKFGEEASEYGLTVSKIIPEKGETVFELQSALKDRTGYSYRSLRPAGLYSLYNRSMSGPGFETANATPVLLNPRRKGAAWEWFAPFRGQTMVGPDGKAPDTKELDQNCRAAIETVDESVVVPAGSFKCYRVKITKTSKTNGTSFYFDWISPEAGLVKRHIPSRGEQVAGLWELTKFTPGH